MKVEITNTKTLGKSQDDKYTIYEIRYNLVNQEGFVTSRHVSAALSAETSEELETMLFQDASKNIDEMATRKNNTNATAANPLRKSTLEIDEGKKEFKP